MKAAEGSAQEAQVSAVSVGLVLLTWAEIRLGLFFWQKTPTPEQGEALSRGSGEVLLLSL